MYVRRSDDGLAVFVGRPAERARFVEKGHAGCLRCGWYGEAKGAACPSCGQATTSAEELARDGRLAPL